LDYPYPGGKCRGRTQGKGGRSCLYTHSCLRPQRGRKYILSSISSPLRHSSRSPRADSLSSRCPALSSDTRSLSLESERPPEAAASLPSGTERVTLIIVPASSKPARTSAGPAVLFLSPSGFSGTGATPRRTPRLTGWILHGQYSPGWSPAIQQDEDSLRVNRRNEELCLGAGW